MQTPGTSDSADIWNTAGDEGPAVGGSMNESTDKTRVGGWLRWFAIGFGIASLFFLARDKDQPSSPRLLNALKVRVLLSIALVVFLVISYQFGWIAR